MILPGGAYNIVTNGGQDSFTKTDTQSKNSKSKTFALTSIGAVAGGLLGGLKEKLNPKKIPYELSSREFDSYQENLIKDKVYKEKFVPLATGMANKLLKNEELNTEEAQLARSLKLNGAKFFDSQKERAKIWADVNNFIKSDGRIYNRVFIFDSVNAPCNPTLKTDIADRMEDIAKNGIENENSKKCLDYISSELYDGKFFKLKFNPESKFEGFVLSTDTNVPKNCKLSDSTYTFRELVDNFVLNKREGELGKIAEKLGRTPYDFGWDLPLPEYEGSAKYKYYNELCDSAIEKAKPEFEQVTNKAIKNFRNKQLLKSAGIGALVIGALTLCSILIHNKITRNKTAEAEK